MTVKLFNYAITEPEDNTFVDICADITHKCNMTCKNCYIPNREPPDMDLDKFKDFMSRLEVEHLYVSLVQNQLSHLSVQNLFVQFIMKAEQTEENMLVH